MGVIPERQDFKNVSPEAFNTFVKRVSVVYDVKARMLSLTAFDDVMPRLIETFNRSVRDDKSAAPKSTDKPNVAKKETKKQPAEKPVSKPDKQQSANNVKKKADKKPETKSDKPQPKKNSAQSKPEQENAAAKKNEPAKKEPQLGFVAPVVKPVPPLQSDDENGNISLKKYTTERFDEVTGRLKKDKKKYKLSLEEITDKGKATELRTITVSGGGQKLKLRFMPKKQVLQLQGKHGALFTELQLLLSEQTDYRAAVDAHIEQNREDKKASEVERQLKKMIPNAFPYLSKQSKIDFTIGVIELINSSEKHYDYSMLLLPPFRGLERLIFDLERAQGVVVKMIGQAYEKEEGEYVLKASYRRKINSIVYAEVMADLYREYFATRNYYAHSDVTADGEVRIIDKKEQASAIFTQMLRKVDYNCKKLSEIGFSI